MAKTRVHSRAWVLGRNAGAGESHAFPLRGWLKFQIGLDRALLGLKCQIGIDRSLLGLKLQIGLDRSLLGLKCRAL